MWVWRPIDIINNNHRTSELDIKQTDQLFIMKKLLTTTVLLAPGLLLCSDGNTNSTVFEYSHEALISTIIVVAALISLIRYHDHALKIGVCALSLIVAINFIIDMDKAIDQLMHSLLHAADIFGLIVSFSMLGFCFKTSRLPEHSRRFLPKGRLLLPTLLFLVWLLSAGLDNVAMGLIGMTIVYAIYPRIHLATVGGVIAAANAGGAWSPFGDTTTMMIVGRGYQLSSVLPAFWGSLLVVIVVCMIVPKQQQKFCPAEPVKDSDLPTFKPVNIVGVIVVLACSLGSLLYTTDHKIWGLTTPLFGLIPSLLVFLIVFYDKNDWKWNSKGSHGGGTKHDLNGFNDLLHGLKAALFLGCLILSAQFVLLGYLPDADVSGGIILSFISGTFDNIPVTEVALIKGISADAVGAITFGVGSFGGLCWWASSAGVAISEQFHDSGVRNTIGYWKANWYQLPLYIAGYYLILLVS